jgi:valyl-tRNA synthetase
MGLGFGSSIQKAAWPEPAGFSIREECDAAFAAVSAARTARSNYNIASNQRLLWLLEAPAPWVLEELPPLTTLLNASEIRIVTEKPSELCATIPTQIGTFYLPLGGLVDVEAECARLQTEVKKVELEITKVRGKLASETFVNNAPAEVVAEHRAREAAWLERAKTLQNAIVALRG